MCLFSFLVNSTRAEAMSAPSCFISLCGVPRTVLHTGLSLRWPERAGGLGEQPEGGQENALRGPASPERIHMPRQTKKLVWQRQRDPGAGSSWRGREMVGSGPKDSCNYQNRSLKQASSPQSEGVAQGQSTCSGCLKTLGSTPNTAKRGNVVPVLGDSQNGRQRALGETQEPRAGDSMPELPEHASSPSSIGRCFFLRDPFRIGNVAVGGLRLEICTERQLYFRIIL